MKNITVVAAATLHNNKVLITQRSKGSLKGLWELPGGKIEPNETHEEALVREIEEELLFTIQPHTFLETIEYQYPDFHLTMHVYICSIENGTPSLTEHSSMMWVSAHELENIKWLPADIALVEPLKNYLINYSSIK